MAVDLLKNIKSDDEGSSSSSSTVDLHTIDLESDNFKTLPAKEKYDLLLELKETRKMNSWGKLHELPKKSDNFSDFQMQRLLKRRKVQECLQETEKEMGDAGMSLNELESLLNEEGIDTKIESLPTKRIAYNNSTRYLLISDVKQALAEAKKKEGVENQASGSIESITCQSNAKKDELENDLEKAIKMSLECGNATETAGSSRTDDSWTSCMTDSESEYSNDSEEEDGCEPPDMTSAKAYIKQYCDFTNEAIDDIVTKNKTIKNKNKKPQIEDILEQINLKKPDVASANYLSSSDEECCSMNNDIINIDCSHKTVDETEQTQQSLVVLENPTQEAIILDSTVEDSPEKDFSHESSNNEFIKGPQIETKKSPTQTINEYDESDSSDNDFEDVPEIDTKHVVQLALNMNNDISEDDIFADVFTNESVEKNIVSEIKDDIKCQPAQEILIDEAEELQKAIMMSLESFEEDNTLVSKSDLKTDGEKQQSRANEILSEIDISSKENPKNSKTVESLNKILATQTSRPNMVTEKNTDKSSKESNAEAATISTDQLNNMVEEIQNEEQGLEKEKSRLDRIGRNITEQMTKEAQELLQIFGIPYIVAPMEAEAQCAFLESVNLTDGTITDDSDIWLFGGKTVYKNFFNQKKHVLQFLAERIETSFKLTREQLILLALLVGSDYTTGIDGVGPVTALEILASFPFNKRKLGEASEQSLYTEVTAGLREFKQWVRSGKRTDNTSLKKKLRNISLHEDFPSIRVVQAYMEPNVEKSKDKFSWGELDITILRDYTKSKFGWSQSKLDEIIKPVLKRMVERKTQKSMQDYFKKKIDIQSLEDQMSKRVKAAVQRIGPESHNADGEQAFTAANKPAGKRKVKKDKELETGSSKSKKKRSDDNVLKNLSVKVVSESEAKESKSDIDIKINKTDRYQEMIPQREKDKQCLLQNKMKAIELFRKTNIDKKKKLTKRKHILPKDNANLSESSDSN